MSLKASFCVSLTISCPRVANNAQQSFNNPKKNLKHQYDKYFLAHSSDLIGVLHHSLPDAGGLIEL
jgi:hypothetical protein